MIDVDLSEEAEKKKNEVMELIRKAYEKYREFYTIKCKDCGGECSDTHREIELHYRFMSIAFFEAIENLSEKVRISPFELDMLFIGLLLRDRITRFIEYRYEKRAQTEDLSYFM